MKVVYLESTEPDLAWYRLYYESVFPAGAKHAAAQYIKAIEGLTDNPRLGPGDCGRRNTALFGPEDTVAIFYRLTGDYIEIVRIWDQRADPRKLELHEEAATFT